MRDPFAGQWLSIAERMDRDQVDWLQARPPNRKWLLRIGAEGEAGDGFLPRGKVGMLAAAGGAGKTMSLLQLALAVALPDEARREDPRGFDRYGWFSREATSEEWGSGGAGWRAPYHVASSGRVLCILGEEDELEIRRRLWRAADAFRLTDNTTAIRRLRRRALERLVIVPGAGNTHLSLTTGAGEDGGTDLTSSGRALVNRLNDTADDWALIVLDPLSRFAGGDSETDNREATALVQAAELLTQVQGEPTVLMAHHTSQGSRKERSIEAWAARGVTALTDGIRWQANMAPEQRVPGKRGLIRFGMSKTNYTKHADPIRLTWTDGGALCIATQSEKDRHRRALLEQEIRRDAESKARNAEKTKLEAQLKNKAEKKSRNPSIEGLK